MERIHMRLRLTAPIAVSLVIFSGACTTPQQRAATDAATIATAKQQVEKRMNDFAAVLRANNWTSFRDFWTQEPQVFESQMEVKGRAAFDALIEGVSTTMNVTTFDLTTSEIFVHDGGTVAYAYGRYSEVDAYKDGKKRPEVANNNVVVRWIREPDGVWRMSRLTATPIPPDASTGTKK